MWHYIYVLRDPRDYRIRYVGRVCGELKNRMNLHLWERHDGWPGIDHSPKHYWIAELRRVGLTPIMQQVDCLEAQTTRPTPTLRALEQLWITHLLKLGYSLLNIVGANAESRRRAWAEYPESASAKIRHARGEK